MHALMRTSLATVTRTSLQSPCRRIANRRFSQPYRCFHQSPRPRIADGDNNKSDDPNEVGETKNEPEDLRGEDALPAKDSCTAKSAPLMKDLAHYGSAARRSKRSKPPEVTLSVRIPQWFVDHNVRPVEDVRGPLVGLRRWDAGRAKYVDPAKDIRSNLEDAREVEPLEDRNEDSVSEYPASDKHTPYFVDSLQWNELLSTARGLLKPTTQFVSSDVASKKNNLILHYAGEGGDYLLDGLIHRLAAALHADTVVLDALDIADLACEPHNSGLSEDVADDRRLLSYDVYERDDGQVNDLHREAEQANESDDQEEDHDPGSIKPAIPTIFMDIRGSSLDVTNPALPRRRRSHRQMDQPGPMITNLGSFLSGRINRDTAASKPPTQPLLPLIEAILAGPFLKRTMKNSPSAGDSANESSRIVPKDQIESPMILEIRDLKLVQQTSFGHKFLQTLYSYIEGRRRKGHRIMIVGTESFPKTDQYSVDSIRSLQSEPSGNGNISRTMVITPVIPSPSAWATLKKDKKRRVRTINMRHLWQMLCIKVPELYENDVVRQAWASHTDDISDGDSLPSAFVGFDSELWTFDGVHRLATIMVGQLETDATYSLKECFREAYMKLRGSDGARFAWVEQQKSNRIKSKPDLERRENLRLDQIRKKLSRHEKKLVGGVIEPQKITTTFDHVHAPSDTIDALKTLTTLSLVRPDAFKYGVLASDKIPGLLLYGPPGTGKTLLAKAVAKESGATVLEVSGAELNDMYVGEGEKNVRALFTLAKKLTPCVVFIDECDAVFSARGSGQRRVSHRDILNQFLREWDGMSNDAGSAFIMMATNRPFDLDDAVLRRLPRRLLVDLPSENDRLEILKIHLRDEILAEDVSLADLAAKTPFYSGSDLKNVAVAAALNCVQEENEQAKRHTGEDAFEHADKRTLTAAHFHRALEDISASISEDMNSLKEIRKFDEQFGDKRGKKKKSSKWGFNTVADAEKALDTVKVRS